MCTWITPILSWRCAIILSFTTCSLANWVYSKWKFLLICFYFWVSYLHCLLWLRFLYLSGIISNGEHQEDIIETSTLHHLSRRNTRRVMFLQYLHLLSKNFDHLEGKNSLYLVYLRLFKYQLLLHFITKK